jgi:8-oxo-dGTP pyrophosphatase MutT (NUDIX family)
MERKEILPLQNTGVIFLFYKEGKILVEDRPESDATYSNLTIIPGGKIKFREGELAEKALDREVEEEFGKGVKITEKFDLGEFCDFTKKGNLQRPRAFLITEFKGKIVNCEPEKGRHRWISINDYDRELPLAASKLIVERA